MLIHVKVREGGTDVRLKAQIQISFLLFVYFMIGKLDPVHLGNSKRLGIRKISLSLTNT